MFDHIGLDVSDLKTSVGFYTAALAPLGHELSSEDHSSAAFGEEGVLYLTADRSTTSSAHIALRAADRSAVDAFYAAALENGGRENGAPAIREDYGPSYYAAYVLDPDGNNIEAVCVE
jgi:catechol 2,3-dioxygenase-like lactoylglutathione lyase family enzyme